MTLVMDWGHILRSNVWWFVLGVAAALPVVLLLVALVGVLARKLRAGRAASSK